MFNYKDLSAFAYLEPSKIYLFSISCSTKPDFQLSIDVLTPDRYPEHERENRNTIYNTQIIDMSNNTGNINNQNYNNIFNSTNNSIKNYNNQINFNVITNFVVEHVVGIPFTISLASALTISYFLRRKIKITRNTKIFKHKK